MHYKHIRQQLTTCWPQNFKPQIKYIVKKKRKKKKNLEKYYIIITKNEWIVVLFLRQILYSFFFGVVIFMIEETCWNIVQAYLPQWAKMLKKVHSTIISFVCKHLLPFKVAKSSKNFSNNSFLPFWRTVLNIGTAWPADVCATKT